MESERDAAVYAAVKFAVACGMPMILARDSQTMVEHALSIGLIPAKR